MYQPIKEQLRGLPVSDGMQMVTAGLVSGSLAAVIFNPLELVKTRMQSKANRLQGPAQVIRAVLAEQGFAGLWKGAGPSVVSITHQCMDFESLLSHSTVIGWLNASPQMNIEQELAKS